MNDLHTILADVELEKRELHTLRQDIHLMKEKILEKRPSHFNFRDVMNAFFGALLVGLTFVFKGSLLTITFNLAWVNIVLIVIFTLVILFIQIYYIGYSRVKDKKHRPLGQFVAKRLVTLYSISIIVSFFLVSLFGIYNTAQSMENAYKLVITVAMPCAIGAAVPTFLKQF